FFGPIRGEHIYLTPGPSTVRVPAVAKPPLKFFPPRFEPSAASREQVASARLSGCSRPPRNQRPQGRTSMATHFATRELESPSPWTDRKDTGAESAQQEIHLMSPMPESTLSRTLTGVDPGRRSRSGPKTPAGKAAVAGNAITYGIFARAHVLPGVERVEDWLAHRAGILASLAQVGYLDTVLAEHAP